MQHLVCAIFIFQTRSSNCEGTEQLSPLVCAIFIFQTRSRACLKNKRNFHNAVLQTILCLCKRGKVELKDGEAENI